MLKFFEFLWSGCWHDWRRTSRPMISIFGDGFGGMRDVRTGNAYEYECSRCHRIKVIET